MNSRFAPSTTGEAHPGTLLSALLVWLDARAFGRRAILRLEDLDTTRVKAVWAQQLVEACEWLGLAWDETIVQSARSASHAAAMDALAASGRLYPCSCSRADRARGRNRTGPHTTSESGEGGRRAPDGGWAYDNTCRNRPLVGHWHEQTEPLRCRLDDDRIELVDDSGVDLSQTPALEMGDPIVRRRDGVIAYHLAVVVDDADEAITHIVRGRDIAPSTATQIMLQRALGIATPRYRHHLLLLESRDNKLAKLHGSIPFSSLRVHHDARTLTGILAHAVGLLSTPTPTSAVSLVADFAWSKVSATDRVISLSDRGLVVL